MIVINLLQRLQSFPRFIFENSIAPFGSVRIEVRDSDFLQWLSFGQSFLIPIQNFTPTTQLTFDAGGLVNEQDHRVNRGFAEVDRQRSFSVFEIELVHFHDQHVQAFHLHTSSWKPIEYTAVTVLGFQEFAKHQFYDFTVTDHPARLLDAFSLRRGQQSTDNDRLAG